jgi:hypothetical protein
MGIPIVIVPPLDDDAVESLFGLDAELPLELHAASVATAAMAAPATRLLFLCTVDLPRELNRCLDGTEMSVTK